MTAGEYTCAPGIERSAEFSGCRKYRYRLARWWGPGRRLVWVMLNPSTADAQENDPTVERCERRARSMGFDGVEVVNIFALRSTDPSALYTAEDPIGPCNEQAILEAGLSGPFVCAWGGHGSLLGQGSRVETMLRALGRELYALKVNRDGSPAHPLYVPYRIEPQPLDVLRRKAGAP